MISVMNDFEIDRNPTSDPDLSFFGMESPIKEDEGSDPMEADEASPPLDLTIEPEEIEEEEERPRASSPALPLHLLPPEKPPKAADVSGSVTGDMVWGKVKSHPWWPGHIFNESFASPSVRRTKRGDFVLVAFFGDSSYGWFDLSELIPFEPNFVEKSKQTTARSFVRAVEESIDEASRRAALGLSCRCHNHYNFRPTRVPNYFEVDVVGYERNGIYSKSQIDRERRCFEPSEALGFLRQLAVTPKEKKTEDVEWYRNVALVLALRRHMFVEFDPTYAQAFGLQPVEPARDEKGVREQAESFAPRVAPLTGPLVFAETLSIKRKSFNKYYATTSKSSSLKKKKNNKYLLKRRDDHPAAAANSPSSLPDPYFAQKLQQQQQQQQPATPPFVLAGAPLISSDTDYVLQRREQAGDCELPQTPPLPVSDDSMDIEPSAVDGAAVRKEKKRLKKRSLDEVNNQEEAKLKMKRKRSEGFGQDFPPLFKKRAVMPSAETEAEFAAESSVALPPLPPRLVVPMLADVDLGPLDQIEMPTVLADLRALALDPFYGVECQVPLLKVLHLLLRFRNQFYSKSLLIESDAQAPAPMVAAAAATASVVPPLRKEPKEQQQREQASSSSSKPAKLLKRPDDPTKAGMKRPPSDRQEEMSAKRSMKVNQVKSLASEKKAALTQKPSPDGLKGVATAAGPSTAEPASRPEKQELVPMAPPPPPPPRGNPAFVLMKFPPKSTLPSVANLKARFARFGSLEVDSIRVYWKSHSCRVKFGHHSDAVRAMQHVESNQVFGPKVDYSIREVEGLVPVPQPEPPRWCSEPQVNGAGSSSGVQLRGGEQQQVVVQQPVQPQGRLKSILKKPGDEAGKESQRVKFMLSGNVNGGGSSSSKRSSPPPSASSAVGFADLPPPRALPLKSASFQLPLPPPPQPRQNTLQPPARSYEPRQQQQLLLPPPLPLRTFESRAPMPPVQLIELPRPLQQQQQQLPVQRPQQRGGGRERDDEDISHLMLSLLIRCNDIVNNLRSLPGFSPYHPL